MDARGVGPLLSLLYTAGGWPVLGPWNNSAWSLLETNVRLMDLAFGGQSFFRVSITTDSKNSSRNVIQLDQPSFGLNREFLVAGVESDRVRAYYRYMVDVAVLLGADRQRAITQLNSSLMLEIQLANLTTPEEDRRDSNRMYNPFTLQDLDREISWMNWKTVLQRSVGKIAPIKDNERIIVVEVEYLKQLGDLLQGFPDEVKANYMMWSAVRVVADMLTTALRQRQQEFFRETQGLLSRRPRWAECVVILTAGLPIALSSMYVKNFFDGASKKTAQEITENIRQEMSKEIMTLDWMDGKTKQFAEDKVSKMAEFIGYPNECLDIDKVNLYYQRLEMSPDHFFEAMLDLAVWSVDSAYRELRQPVNKTDWRTHCYLTIVNAFYSAQENSIQFPAGILQPPFFSADVPNYVNYGTLGAVIGHEITHGFDDMGRLYDADGDLKDWWGKNSSENFIAKKQCVIDQYQGFRDPQTNLSINGINTQGENIADIGGMKLAYQAYQRWAAQLDSPEPGLPNLQQYTPDQLLMLSLANMWCTKYRTEYLEVLETVDVHSPAEFRVNGIFMNLPEFGDVYQCNVGDPMNPQVKCGVW